MADEATFHTRAHRGREREQRESLATLGLSEVEAVEYVLMLSRDEADERVRNEGSTSTDAVGVGSSHDIDEGVFEGDFDSGDDGSGHSLEDDMTSVSTSIGAPSIVSSNSSGSSGSFSSGRSSATTSPIARLGHPIPGVIGMSRFSPSSHSSGSSTNQKVQISPRERAEPLEAGVEWREGDYRGEIEEEMRGTRLGLEDHFFPPIGSTRKNVDEIDETDFVLGTSSSKSNKKKSSVPSSSAWSTPLTKKLTFSPSNNTPSWSAVASGSRVSPSTGRSPFIGGGDVVGFDTSQSVEDLDGSEIDEDLRFALELSLAEAKSIKEDI